MKKLLSIILSILMVATTVPFAFAADTPIAKIGDVEYTDFNEALVNWVDGTTLVLLADTPEYTEDIEIKDKAVVLDLNGHIMQFSTTESKTFRIWENGVLTIRDSIGTGEVNTCYSSAYINKGALTIEGGTLIGAIFNWIGILTMTGGKVVGYSSQYGFDTQATHGDGTFNFYGGTLKGSHGVWDMPGAVVNFSGAVVVEATDKICSDQGTTTITGGTFSHDPTSYVAEGCDITKNDNGTWTVTCNHSFTNHVETTAPTCTQTGIATAKCDICSIVTDEKEIPATNHKNTLVQVDEKAPTCTEIGWDAYEYCTACTYTTYVELPVDPDAHTPLEAVKENEVAPKCDVTGSYDLVVYCACGEELDRDKFTVEALTHSFTKYEVTEEAKCGVEGKEVAACDNGCGETDEKAIAALTHKDADGDYKCDNGCGHEFEKPAPEEPTPDTPDEPEEDNVCADCGKVHTNFFSEIICFFTRIINFIKNLFA